MSSWYHTYLSEKFDSTQKKPSSFTLFRQNGDSLEYKHRNRMLIDPLNGKKIDQLRTLSARITFLPLKDTLWLYKLNEDLEAANKHREPDQIKVITAAPPVITEEE